METINEAYSKHYLAKQVGQLYPTEWLVRTFKGKYPNLKFSGKKLIEKSILELGFGDGRNFQLLQEFSSELYGLEITQDIVNHAANQHKNTTVKFIVGRNDNIPLPDKSIFCIVTCHSFYYCSMDFSKNLDEVARVIESGGWFIFDVIDIQSYLFKNAIEKGNNLYQATEDYFEGIRNGALFKAFNSEKEIIEVFGEYFFNFSIGSQKNNYYGSIHNHFFVVCQRK